MDQTRIGIAGAGFIAGKHLQSLGSLPDAKIVAMADPLFDRVQAIAAGIGANAYPDPVRMVEAEALDAVYVCIPPFAHGPLEDALLARGLPFFVEKPLDADLSVAERIATEVETRGLITAVGYHWRYRDFVEQAKARLADNPARLLMGYWLDGTPGAPWWIHEAESGGQMVEQTTHLFDLARHLVGDVTEVYATGVRVPRAGYPTSDVLDASTVTLTFANGAVGSISSTCLLKRNHQIGVTLCCDGLAFDVTDKGLTIDAGDGTTETVTPASDPFVAEDRDFLDAVQGKPNRIRTSYADGLQTHRLAIAAARSAREGRPISL